MIRIFSILLLISIASFSNVFRLSTAVIDQELIPVIQINGRNVMKIKTVGEKQSYTSAFQRSEKIYNTFQFLKKNNSNLNRIRIRRVESNYVAYVDNIELYRVTPSDVVGTGLTPYQLSVQWRNNISNALKDGASANLTDTQYQDDEERLNSANLLSFFLLITNSKTIVATIQICIFIIFQIGIIWGVFRFFSKRFASVIASHQKRLRAYQQVQQQQKNLINNLENQLVDLDRKISSNLVDVKKVSNLSNFPHS